MRAKLLFHRLRVARRGVMVVFLSLGLLERPYWCLHAGLTHTDCDATIAPNSGTPAPAPARRSSLVAAAPHSVSLFLRTCVHPAPYPEDRMLAMPGCAPSVGPGYEAPGMNPVPGLPAF